MMRSFSFVARIANGRVLSLFLVGSLPFCLNAWGEISGSSSSAASAQFRPLFFESPNLDSRAGLRTDGVLIWQDSRILYEDYARGFSRSNKHILWSISKTITALLYGVAERENRVKRSQSICDFLPEKDRANCAIRFEDLLSWSSGLYWKEEYENALDIKNSSVAAMLYGEGRTHIGQFILQHNILPPHRPGQIWRYSSGDTVLISFLLKAIFKNPDLYSVYQEKLFTPLAITDWTCESDTDGTLSSAYGFYLTPGDLLKIGQLLLQRGVYQNKRILNEDFFAFMANTPPAFKALRLDHNENAIPGAHLWINDPSDTGFPRPWPHAPLDTLVARGHWGQYLAVLPSRKAIAIRLGDTRDKSINAGNFLNATLQVLAASGSPPAASQESQSNGSSTRGTLEVRPPDPKSTGSPAPNGIKGVSLPPEPSQRKYKSGMIDLALAFTAKSFCSCLFVVKNSESQCRNYASLKQLSPSLSADFGAKRTRSSWFYFFTSEAQFLDDKTGCRLL